MNYIIKSGEWAVAATYPVSNRSFIRPHLTKHANIFTDDDLLFKGKDIFDMNIVGSPVEIFTDGSWWGFRKEHNILIIIPENISNSGMKKTPPKPQPKLIPFENMYVEKRMSFDDWLKEINYDWKGDE